jgi:CRISPR system Cascade subunit CasA
MARFNLVDEPWVPCLMAVGPPAELSLRDVFSRAGEVRAVATASPLATAAIHRLLLAILQRAGLPGSLTGWLQLWRQRDLQVDRVLAYLDEVHDRFDLFDRERPFYQTPGLPERTAVTAAKLLHELNAGNNAALFDHSLDDAPPALTPAEAARALLATQCFAAGGLLAFDDPKHRSADAGPLTKGAVAVVTGDNLLETLLLNLFEMGEPSPDDRPAWEQDTPTRPMDRRPDGPLDLLTWQCRRVLLLPEEDGDLVVRRAVIMKGYQFPDSSVLAAKEPMLAFWQILKPPTGQDPNPPVGFRPERAAWRDSLALLVDREATKDRRGFRAPKVIADLRNRMGELPDDEPRKRLMVYGLAVDRAKLLLWRQEELPLPPAYLRPDGGNLIALLERALDASERAASALQGGTRELAKRALAPGGNPDRERVDDLVEHFGAERVYWAALDAPFRHLMASLPAAYPADRGRGPLLAWRDAVSRAARDAFDHAARAVETDARGWHAAAEARGLFGALLGGALKTFTEGLPEEVTQ